MSPHNELRKDYQDTMFVVGDKDFLGTVLMMDLVIGSSGAK